ncbi:GNAT family N-acetyltransferase [Clostridium sp.]|uniref:GNAT family N-acetyltransferase n=1 Tax=Clostridium sp. TaxID=1506 RepID=UPI002FC64145
MSEIFIELLNELDAEKLFKFECENRDYFESMVPSRGEYYYNYDNFKAIFKDILQEQHMGLAYMYLIKDCASNIIGRVNLVSVVRGRVNKAELGYRIGKAYVGRGYATKAVGLVLKEARNKHALHYLEAGAASDNIGSQRVLIKNGFKFTERISNYIYHNGKWKDSINFERRFSESVK